MAVLFSCSPKEQDPTPEQKVDEGPVAEVYVTSITAGSLFKEDKAKILEGRAMATYQVDINESTTYQTIDGFGAAITGSTCYNLLKMSQEKRTAFLKEHFDPKEGLGSSLIRVSIGSSDFGLDEYTCCDKEGIENFALHELDRRDVIPILKEIYAINPDVKIIGSPWTAPRWMKRNVNSEADYYSWTSGRLKPSCYQDYATYFVKWIQAMEAEGFNIYAITVQNEPLNKGNSMSMYMPWNEQRDFIKTALGPAFKQAGIKAKILLFDHNYNYDGIVSQKNYPLNILADEEAAQYVAGSAWHNYGGSPTELSNIQAKAPEKEIFFTESSIGTWNYAFEGSLLGDFSSIFIQTMARGNKGVTYWNLMLDQNGAPNRPGGCQTCFGAVTIDKNGYSEITKNSQWYDIAHASKVVRPGAVRIGTSDTSIPDVSYLAFKNTDGSYAVVLLNTSSDLKTVGFNVGGKSVKYNMPGRGIVSLRWKI